LGLAAEDEVIASVAVPQIGQEAAHDILEVRGPTRGNAQMRSHFHSAIAKNLNLVKTDSVGRSHHEDLAVRCPSERSPWTRELERHCFQTDSIDHPPLGNSVGQQDAVVLQKDRVLSAARKRELRRARNREAKRVAQAALRIAIPSEDVGALMSGNVRGIAELAHIIVANLASESTVPG